MLIANTYKYSIKEKRAIVEPKNTDTYFFEEDEVHRHKWAKWEQYAEEGTEMLVGYLYPADVRGKTISYKEFRQRRTCEVCGKMQDEKVRDDD